MLLANPFSTWNLGYGDNAMWLTTYRENNSEDCRGAWQPMLENINEHPEQPPDSLSRSHSTWHANRMLGPFAHRNIFLLSQHTQHPEDYL